MSVPSIFSLFLLSHLLVLHSAEEQKINRNRCPESFDCGTHGPIQFPFYNNTCYSQCGLYRVNCTKSVPTLNLGKSLSYNVLRNFSDDDGAIRVNDTLLATLISTNSCDVFAYYMNWTLEATPSVSFSFSPNLTLFKCLIISPNVGLQNDKLFSGSDSYRDCRGSAVYYKFQDHNRIWNFGHIPKVCSVIHLPVLESIGDRNASNLFSVLASEFDIRVNVLKQCRECHRNGGQCSKDLQGFRCAKKRRSYLLLILGTGVVLLLCLLALIIQRANKWKHTSSNISSKNTSFEPSSKADLEGGSAYFGVPVFSYAELKEATCNFDSSKELGDGGFGTVYHGKLQDGREVAVKRLYEHNYKRVKQFMNEIEILTCLSHPNLVTLYGCTSRHSQELLLVYKYIPNGTVADHLHGDRAKDGSLTWLIRLNIAIQTAGALAFLHDSDIVHRDVKTNNILLDNDFCVKVADFGLSRLFPTDVTHVSTAPQGTPGYVDPEYHQCYQLTDKSDVYSFGVVLIELVSSMPAVDVNRHRHDINLANLAINKIQSCALKELIDPSLGFESDSSIEVMTTMVAELSFRCLQLDKEMRPSMKEVLEALKEIQGYKHENIGEAIDNGEVLKGTQTPSSPEGDQITLLTNSKVPLSPDSVTNSWVSRCTTSTSTSNG